MGEVQGEGGVPCGIKALLDDFGLLLALLIGFALGVFQEQLAERIREPFSSLVNLLGWHETDKMRRTYRYYPLRPNNGRQ